MMDLETLRFAYLRWAVAPILGGLGLKTSLWAAQWLAGRVSRLRSVSCREAEARCRDALQGRVATSPILAPESGLPAQAITADMYRHVARFWVETLFIHRRLRDSSWRRFVRVENESGFAGLHQRGCLLATACFGNPAVAAVALGRIFRPVHVIADFFDRPQLHRWQHALYRTKWVRPIQRHEAATRIPAVLRQGEAVLMLCDHERRRGPCVSTPFLGRVLNCYPTLGRLACWFDVPVGVLTCRRDVNRSFGFNLALHSVVRPSANVDRDSPGAESARIVREVMVTLERVILACPEQYFWLMPTMDRGSGSSPGGAGRSGPATAHAHPHPDGSARIGRGPVASSVP